MHEGGGLLEAVHGLLHPLEAVHGLLLHEGGGEEADLVLFGLAAVHPGLQPPVVAPVIKSLR